MPITPAPRLIAPGSLSLGAWTDVTIIEASISIVPAVVKTLPRPQLKSGSSSRRETACTAASMAVVPFLRRACVERR
jgi:hypothetical protein